MARSSWPSRCSADPLGRRIRSRRPRAVTTVARQRAHARALAPAGRAGRDRTVRPRRHCVCGNGRVRHALDPTRRIDDIDRRRRTVARRGWPRVRSRQRHHAATPGVVLRRHCARCADVGDFRRDALRRALAHAVAHRGQARGPADLLCRHRPSRVLRQRAAHAGSHALAAQGARRSWRGRDVRVRLPARRPDAVPRRLHHPRRRGRVVPRSRGASSVLLAHHRVAEDRAPLDVAGRRVHDAFASAIARRLGGDRRRSRF